MKRALNSIASIIVTGAIIFNYSSCDHYNVLRDQQGNVYQTVKIGEQFWMSQNLLLDVGTGSYCYEDNPEQCIKLGRLYTWGAAQEAASQIERWHLPTKREWQELISYCGGDTAGYIRIISEELGFDPQWSGVRISTGTYKGKEYNGVNYWSSTVADSNSAYAYSVAILSGTEIISPHNYPKENACSVRLIRDK